MRREVLLGCCALVLAAVAIPESLGAQGTGNTLNVNVRVDCLAGRGASFSLVPWQVVVQPDDSVNWVLEFGANVSEMEILNRTPGNRWPFVSRPPYRVTKDRPIGARARQAGQSDRRYKYAVSAICVRSATESDTLVIDPDMIIIRR
jgi:hypothetical protein